MLDYLYIHSSATRGSPSYLFMPAGVFGLLNELRRAGHAVQGVNEPLEMALDEDFSLRQFLVAHPARLYGIDIHWHEHLYGALEVARLIKEVHPSARVVAGGLAATFFAEDLARRYPVIDYVIGGYAERTLLRLLGEVTGGSPPSPGAVLRSDEPVDLDAVDDVSADWLLHAEEYSKTSLNRYHPDREETSFWYRNGTGCLYDCSYCGGAASGQASLLGHSGLLRRSPARVVADLKQLASRGITVVNLIHDPAMGSPAYARALFDAVRDSGVKLGAYLEVNQLVGEEFIRGFVQAFRPEASTLVFTPLCGDERVRRANGKGFSDRQLQDCLRRVQAAGVRINLYWASGLPGETKATRMRTRLLKTGLDRGFDPRGSVITPLTLDPGCPMYLQPEEHGIRARLHEVEDFVRRCRRRSAGEQDYDNAGYELVPGGRVGRAGSAAGPPTDTASRASASTARGAAGGVASGAAVPSCGIRQTDLPRPPRVLLVSANPNLPTFVSPYGLEIIAGALQVELGAQVQIVDPFLGFPHKPLLPLLLSRYEPDVVGIGFRNLDFIFAADETRGGIIGRTCLPELEAVVRTVLDCGFPPERILLGGAGFSVAPHQILRRVGLPYGILGPGTSGCTTFVRAALTGESVESAAGLVSLKGDLGEVPPLRGPCNPASDIEEMPFPSRIHRRILAERNLPFPLRTTSGCGHRCSYCVEGATQGRPARSRSLQRIESELGLLQSEGAKRVMFADGELNAQDREHLEGVLKQVADRGLSWRAYFLPRMPGQQELQRMQRSRCEGILFTVDTAGQEPFERLGRPGSIPEMSEALARYAAAGLPVEATLIFGLPGETDATIDETVALIRRHPTVHFNYSCGARVYPNTPLAEYVEETSWAHVYGSGESDPLEISLYSEPAPPWELRGHLTEALAGVENASPNLGGEGRLTGSPLVSPRRA